MKGKRIRRFAGRLGLALAVTAAITPAAQAMPLDVPPRGLDSVQARQYADDIRVDAVVLTPQVRQYADDGSSATPRPTSDPRGYAPINIAARPDLVTPQPALVSSSDTGGFDWHDAGIGGGAMLLLIGLGLVGVAVVYSRHHGHKDRLAAT